MFRPSQGFRASQSVQTQSKYSDPGKVPIHNQSFRPSQSIQTQLSAWTQSDCASVKCADSDKFTAPVITVQTKSKPQSQIEQAQRRL